VARRRRSILTPIIPPSPKKLQRVVTKLPQPAYRPLSMRTRKFAKPPKLIGRDPFILHRRSARDTYGPEVQERRAVSSDSVFGSLGERIFYKALTQWNLRDGADFSFQSGILGGRLETGGMVADFIFHSRMLVVRVQSVRWHYFSASEIQRDDDQKQVLESMGYVVLDLWENIIFNEMELEDWIRRNIAIMPTLGPMVAVGIELIDMAIVDELKDQIHRLQDRTVELEDAISSILGYPPTNELVVARANIDTAAISNANVNDMAADKITAGSLAVDSHIQSTGYSAGTTGFKIEGGGDAEFGNITARGELKSTGQVQGTQSIYGGELIVASGVAILIADVAVGDESIDVKTDDLRALDNLQFQPTGARVEWMRVREAGTAITGGFRYPVDRAIAGTEQVFYKGEIGAAKGRALDKVQRSSNWGEFREGATAPWGNLGVGWGSHGKVGYHADTFPRLGNNVSADEIYSDSFLGIDRRDSTDPDDGLTAYARIGSLAGFLDYSSTPAPTSQITGLAVGASNSNFISWDSTNGLQMTNKTAGIQTDETGWISKDQSSGTSDNMRWQNTSGAQQAHMYLHSDNSMYMVPTPGEAFVVGTLASSTYKNWIRIEPADATFENANSIVMYDDDGGSYTMSEAMGAIWAGADSGGSYAPEDMHIGAADDIHFYTAIDGTPAAKFSMGNDGTFWIKDGITAPSTVSTWAGIYVDSADGDLKVKFGDGTVKTLATDT